MTVHISTETEIRRAALAERIEEIRSACAGGHGDVRTLSDQLQGLIQSLVAVRMHVPSDLREKASALEAEILEEFYDNLPV